jgi:hypothetical protein
LVIRGSQAAKQWPSRVALKNSYRTRNRSGEVAFITFMLSESQIFNDSILRGIMQGKGGTSARARAGKGLVLNNTP